MENANTTKILVTVGVAEDYDEFELDVLAFGSSSIIACVGIGLDSTSVNSADAFPGMRSADKGLAMANLKTLLAVGCHSIYWLESTNGGSATFYGVYIAGQSVSGLTGMVWC